MEPIDYSSQERSQELTVTYAGFWWRVLAALIDGIVLFIAGFIMSQVLLASGVRQAVVDQEVMQRVMFGGEWTIPELYQVTWNEILINNLVSIGMGWLYFAGMESSAKQGTLGKMALGITVTGKDGGRVSFLRATARHFAKWLSGITLFVGYIMAGFTEKKQTLHDMVAGCLVMKRQ